MTDISKLIDGLKHTDDNYAYQCLKQLQSLSAESNAVYSYFDAFAEMIYDPKSYIRTRGLLLIAANAKWDKDNKIDEIIDEYLKHIMDDKPITSRQCIKVLPEIARHNPELRDSILSALRKANPMIYNSHMQNLIYKDIQDASKSIERL